MELQELGHKFYCDDDTMPDSYPVADFVEMFEDTMSNIGVDARVAPKLGAFLEEAGYINVSCRTFKVPLGIWPKDT